VASVSSLNGLSVCNVVYATGLHGFCVLVFFGFYGWFGTVVSLVSVVCVIGLFFFLFVMVSSGFGFVWLNLWL
jgi:hypothetical protein